MLIYLHTVSLDSNCTYVATLNLALWLRLSGYNWYGILNTKEHRTGACCVYVCHSAPCVWLTVSPAEGGRGRRGDFITTPTTSWARGC